MKKLKFYKMQSLGNDFMVIDAISQSMHFSELPIQQLAHRHLGIGFDQLLLISQSKKNDFFCHIFNSDGSKAEQCGNGLRCITRLMHDLTLIKKKSYSIETKAGEFVASILAENKIQVAMGAPCFDPSLIPFITEVASKTYSLALDNSIVNLTVLSMGNPHAILQVPSLTNYPIYNMGSQLAKHQAFPKGINIGFMEIKTPNHIGLRTFERGAGETYACGSNACAAVVAGIVNQLLAHKVTVELELGELEVEWSGVLNEPVKLTGPANYVYEGVITI